MNQGVRILLRGQERLLNYSPLSATMPAACRCASSLKTGEH